MTESMKKDALNKWPVKNIDYKFVRQAVPVAQINMPSWERFEATFKDIFKRQYYTNHGPLAQELEQKLEDFLGVKNAILMNNATIGLIITQAALGVKGKVITPAFTFIATPQSISWAGAEPVFCDVDINTHQLNCDAVERILKKDKNKEISAILAVNLWGSSSESERLQKIADKYNIKLIFDSAQGFGCERNGVNLANLGDASVFSFHATKILNAAEGGCVTTNNNELAETIRNMRSSYGVRETVSIPFTGNGRMSEAQAAMALMSLEDFEQNRGRNQKTYEQYCQRLEGINGFKIYKPDSFGKSNYQYIICEIDESKFGLSRDRLAEALYAENIFCRKYFAPGAHRSKPYCDDLPQYVDSLKNTDILSKKLIQLPCGQDATPEILDKVCDTIIVIHKNFADIHPKN